MGLDVDNFLQQSTHMHVMNTLAILTHAVFFLNSSIRLFLASSHLRAENLHGLLKDLNVNFFALLSLRLRGLVSTLETRFS